MKRIALVSVVAAAQLVLVAVAVAPQLSARVTGETYTLAVAPVDPIDPFRGAYVALDYPGITSPEDDADATDPDLKDPDAWEEVRPVTELTGDVYVPLLEDGPLWRPGTPAAERPDAGPYLSCHADGWNVRCGIESFFTSQERARDLEEQLVGPNPVAMVAEVKVDTFGNAHVADVRPATSDEQP